MKTSTLFYTYPLTGLVLLVSAPGIPSDIGSNTTINGSDGTTFNITATPHRLSTNNSMGYVQLNITTDKDVNKSFTLSSGESHIDLLDNRSVSLNTTVFNVPDGGFNKSYNLTDEDGSNVSLVVEFKDDKPFNNPLSGILPSPQGQVVVITAIQDAVDASGNGDTVIIPSGTYTGLGNKSVNIANKNLNIMGSGGDVVIGGEGTDRIFNITNSNVNISGLKIQNTNIGNDFGGAINYGSGGSVNGCTFTNTSSSLGGAVFIGGGNVSGCTIVNCTSGSGGAGIHVYSGTVNVSYNRFVDNKLSNGSVSSVNGFSGSRDFNWWGTNNISDAGINGNLPTNYYQIELSAGDTSTRDVNMSVNGLVPVALGYKMILNGSNSTGDISNLPDFNATIKLDNNTGLFRNNNDLLLFRFSMMPDSDVNTLAKEPWNDTMNSAGDYIFSGVVDNQQLNFNISAERMNTSLNITKTVDSTQVIVGDLVGYTIQVTNNGTNNITTPILVNDTLNSSLEYVSSVGSVGVYDSGTGLWTIIGLNSGDTATLNITVKVKNTGNVNNSASLVLDDYNNSLTNDSSVIVTAVNPNNGGGSGSDDGNDGSGDGFDQTFVSNKVRNLGNEVSVFKSLETGFPLLVLLVVLSVLGLVYYKRK